MFRDASNIIFEDMRRSLSLHFVLWCWQHRNLVAIFNGTNGVPHRSRTSSYRIECIKLHRSLLRWGKKRLCATINSLQEVLRNVQTRWSYVMIYKLCLYEWPGTSFDSEDATWSVYNWCSSPRLFQTLQYFKHGNVSIRSEVILLKGPGSKTNI